MHLRMYFMQRFSVPPGFCITMSRKKIFVVSGHCFRRKKKCPRARSWTFCELSQSTQTSKNLALPWDRPIWDPCHLPWKTNWWGVCGVIQRLGAVMPDPGSGCWVKWQETYICQSPFKGSPVRKCSCQLCWHNHSALATHPLDCRLLWWPYAYALPLPALWANRLCSAHPAFPTLQHIAL